MCNNINKIFRIKHIMSDPKKNITPKQEPLKLEVAPNFQPDAQELTTGRTCIIAQSGAGKSYTVAVLCELMLKAGVPFCIIDTEGEYFSLKQKFELLWAGEEGADVQIGSIDLQALADQAVNNGIPLIFDISDVIDQSSTVAAFCKALYDIETRLKRPYLLIVEESDKFVPQQKPGVASPIIEEISRRGRKRGLGILLATQRPALISKSVLSQCGNQILGKLTTEADLAAVNLFFPSRKELAKLPKLSTGEFFAMGNLTTGRIKFKARQRETAHTGLTPKLIPKPAQKIFELAQKISHTSPPFPIMEEHEEVSEDIGKHPKKRTKVSVNDSVKSTAKVSSSGRMLEPAITKEAALQIAEGKKKSKFGIFGQKETLTGFDLAWRPIVYAQIAKPKGIIKKSIHTTSVMLDGKSAKFVSLRNGLRFEKGLEDVIGLSEGASRALLAIRKKSGLTLAELQSGTNLSEGSLRSIMTELRERKLVTYSKIKNVNYYTLLANLKIPDLDQDAELPERLSANSGKFGSVGNGGKVEHPVFSQTDLRAIIKALDSSADLVRFDIFYYPVWTAHLRGKTNRVVCIDGMTGKEIEEKNLA
jgi:hypothetical protein